MSWRERMQPASFRGVPFAVQTDDKTAGRSSVLHELPQRDQPFVEDMGAAPQTFTVQAFVCGADYMDRRDALEDALLQPGPGTLVHPWYGEITVSQTALYRVRHTADDGGMAVFTLTFTRDEEAASPAPAVNQQARGLEKLGLAGDLACGDFDGLFKVVGEGAYVVQTAYNSVSDAFSRVQAALGGDFSGLATLLGAVTGYDFTSWLSMGQSLWSGLRQIAAKSGKSRPALASAWNKVASTAVATPTVAKPGGTRARIAANDVAVNDFVRRIAVVEAARSLTLAAPESRGEAQILREDFMDALDAVLHDDAATGLPESIKSLMPDKLHIALADVRAASLAALAENARRAPDVITFTPTASLPSLALCYRLTGAISLEQDLVARNQVLHPGFMPVRSLEVLIDG